MKSVRAQLFQSDVIVNNEDDDFKHYMCPR